MTCNFKSMTHVILTCPLCIVFAVDICSQRLQRETKGKCFTKTYFLILPVYDKVIAIIVQGI